MSLKKLMMALGLISALGGAFVVIQSVDSRYATAAEVREVMEKVRVLTKEQKRHGYLEDMKEIRKRLWAIEDRWSGKYLARYGHTYESLLVLKSFMTPEAREHFRDLETEYAELEEKLKALEPPKKKEE